MNATHTEHKRVLTCVFQAYTDRNYKVVSLNDYDLINNIITLDGCIEFSNMTDSHCPCLHSTAQVNLFVIVPSKWMPPCKIQIV